MAVDPNPEQPPHVGEALFTARKQVKGNKRAPKLSTPQFLLILEVKHSG